MDPQPIPYATPPRKGVRTSVDLAPASVTWRTAAGGAWLLVLLAAATYVAGWLYDQQRVLTPLFTGASVSDVLAPLFVNLRRTLWSLAERVGSVGFTIAIGAGAAAVLYDWSPKRLAAVALLPAIVALGLAMVILSPLTFYGGSLAWLAIIVCVQAALIYAGTRIGRPVARWLTRQLVPPPLRASLLALWG